MSDAEEPLGSPDDDASALVAVMDFVGGPSCVAPPELNAVAVVVRWGGSSHRMSNSCARS